MKKYEIYFISFFFWAGGGGFSIFTLTAIVKSGFVKNADPILKFVSQKLKLLIKRITSDMGKRFIGVVSMNYGHGISIHVSNYVAILSLMCMYQITHAYIIYFFFK